MCAVEFLTAFEIHHAQRMSVAKSENARLILEAKMAGLDLRTVLAGTSHFDRKEMWQPKIFDPSMVRKVAAMFLLLPWLALAQPPPPPMSALLRSIGREGNHYTMAVSVVVTQTVTTVYELDYLRIIRLKLDGTNGTYRTNFLLLETNAISCVTNTSQPTP